MEIFAGQQRRGLHLYDPLESLKTCAYIVQSIAPNLKHISSYLSDEVDQQVGENCLTKMLMVITQVGLCK